MPRKLKIVIFRIEENSVRINASLIDDKQNQYDIDGMHTSDEDTKNIFDFTGKLQKLNESGAL